LRDTLAFLSSFKGRIYIELKCKEAEVGVLARAVCGLIGDSPVLPQMIVKSFTLAAIRQVRAFCPRARTAALFEPTIRSVVSKQRNVLDVAARFGAEEISIHFSLLTRRLAKLAELQNIPITIWTVDDPKWLSKAQERGIRALITNDPGLMIKRRDER
jgi:glycerophosphoryl diester phosphodiesterase